ncbi:MAG: TetR family transcriptional regulator [Haliea sp.]|jgi:AcrR family transcriptional regulator|nr:TetR family transcriptional regulator [Haliea sp.]
MASNPKPDRKAYHHGDLRKALLDDAVKLLREEGEAGLSMRNLAARAGVSRTAAYHHFEGKHALLCAVAEEGFKRFGKVFYPPEMEGDDSLNEQRIQRFVQDYIKFATGNSEYYDLMFGSQLWKTEKLTETLTQEAYRTFRGYVDGIRGWQESGQISKNLDPLRYAQVSWSTLHGMSRLLIDGIYVDNQSRNAMCQAAADMLWRELNA